MSIHEMLETFFCGIAIAFILWLLTGCAQLGDAIRSGGVSLDTKYGRVTYELPHYQLPQHYNK